MFEDGTNGRTGLRRWLAERQPLLCRGVPFVAAFCFLAWCATCLRSDFTWDDAESEVLNNVWRMAQGQDIYRDIHTPPFVFAAYPPLYFAVSAFFLKFAGLSFLPARLVSLAAMLSIGWAIAVLARSWGRTARTGLWAASFLLLIPAFIYNAARCHPQMLAVALSIWSLVFFLRNRWQYTLVVSPLLTVLAIYTKQTQIALPLAMVVYLALRNRKWLLSYISVLAAGGLIPLFWLQRSTGGYFFRDTFQWAQLSYDALNIPLVFLHHAGPVLIFGGIALSFLWKRFRSGRWEAIDCYLVVIFFFTLFTLGRAGAHGQYVVELLTVTLIYLVRLAPLPELPVGRVWASVQILILFLYAPLFVFLEEGLFNRAANRVADSIYQTIKVPPGSILSQQGSFPLFSRDGIHVQLFHFTGLSWMGVWDQKYLLDEIDNRVFPYVITEFPFEKSGGGANETERFTPEMLAALRRNYELVRAAYPYYIYRPNQAPN